MIAARLHDASGGIALLLVLEPGNLEKLKEGKPIHKFLNEFLPELQTKVELVFAYTPDAAWVSQQMKGCETDIRKLLKLLEESLSRAPVLVRDRTAEEMKKFQ
jgi:hypothetical protein